MKSVSAIGIRVFSTAKPQPEGVQREVGSSIGGTHIVVFVAEVIGIDSEVLESAIRAPRPIERLVRIGFAEFIENGRNKISEEDIHRPVAFLVEHAGTVEGPTGIGPVQWRNETLGTVQQFLATHTGS